MRVNERADEQMAQPFLPKVQRWWTGGGSGGDDGGGAQMDEIV